MKAIIAGIFVFTFITTDWLTNFDAAKETAARENKNILLNFSGSDWCGPCIKMKREVFETETFQSYASERLVLVRADFPRLKKNQLEKSQTEHNEALAEKYNPSGKFPLTLLLNAKGEVIETWDGFNNQTPEDFIKELKAASTK